ncbi:FAD-binding oxidoreductase [Georgenia deserti]|uniref:FAD-binding oxidoreductase n=1 Tax=Georgenia deserti TaxID=2093781 RepID=A0ABW4L544_9MICO
MHAVEQLGERVTRPGSPTFEEATRLEFAGEPRVPSAVVRASSTDDVVAAVRAAQEDGLPLAVRTGGHSYGRHSLADGGLVLDTRLMDGVEIDAAARVGRAQGGVTAGAYTVAAAEHGLATGFGDTKTVGVAGLVLGGGIGFLSRRDGLTVDNLLAAEVVLADGTVVVADADRHPDLFWALRGGGGNFGVVTSMSFRLVPTSTVVGGFLAFEASPETLKALVAAVRAAPDELSAMVNVMRTPPVPFLPEEMHGATAIMAIVCWSGAPEEAERALAPLRNAGSVLADMVSEQPYAAMIEGPPNAGDVVYPAVTTGFADTVDASWSRRAVEAVTAAETPMAVVNLRPMGGAVARVPSEATAFAHRSRGVMTTVAALYPDPALSPVAQAWAATTGSELGLAGAGYVNFMAGATTEDVAAAYPGETLARLREVKRAYDPDNVFRSNLNISPA